MQNTQYFVWFYNIHVKIELYNYITTNHYLIIYPCLYVNVLFFSIVPYWILFLLRLNKLERQHKIHLVNR